MSRIIIEVGDEAAKKWNIASEIYKKKIAEKVSTDIQNILDENKKQNFLNYLDDLGKTMKERGLTEEALNDILKDND